MTNVELKDLSNIELMELLKSLEGIKDVLESDDNE